MNSMRSLVRQAAKPFARNAFAKRTIYSTRASLSDAIFVVMCQYTKEMHKCLILTCLFNQLNSTIIQLTTQPIYQRIAP
jgi:hypothetical protein